MTIANDSRAAMLYERFAIGQDRVERVLASLLVTAVKIYRDTISRELIEAGCTGSTNAPGGSDRQALVGMLATKSSQVATTRNSALERYLADLVASNPDASIGQLTQDVARWQRDYMANRMAIIQRDIKGDVENYAKERFFEENNQNGKTFIWWASPLIIETSSDECIRRVRMGSVPLSVASRWARNRPHPHCRHKIRITGGYDIRCENAWRG